MGIHHWDSPPRSFHTMRLSLFLTAMVSCTSAIRNPGVEDEAKTEETVQVVADWVVPWHNKKTAVVDGTLRVFFLSRVVRRLEKTLDSFL